MRAFAEAAEGLGYAHLVFYDHVLGADTNRRPDWQGPYSHEDTFHEPLVTFGYLAALTSRIELVSGIIILPQRQTVLVAKQAAQVDVLSGGRLRLGVGIGWNDVEYEGLGQNFHDRGKRSEEQVELLRALWTNEVVDFQGRWHSIPGAGIKPLPVQRPIPVWFGGGRSDGVLRRIARIGDGWFPQLQADEQGRERMERSHPLWSQERRTLRADGASRKRLYDRQEAHRPYHRGRVVHPAPQRCEAEPSRALWAF